MNYKEAAVQLRNLHNRIQDRRPLEIYSDIHKRDIEALRIGIKAIEQAKKGETANWVICCDGYSRSVPSAVKNLPDVRCRGTARTAVGEW